MIAVCPNCRHAVAAVAHPCPQPGCKRRAYHGVPPEYLGDKVDSNVGLLLADKYLLVRLLGKGGMGVVMVALQQPLMREVALKLISGVKIDDTMRARFLREARAVAALDHPNIVRLVDFGVAKLDEDAPYMVMELVSGAETLRKLLARWQKEPVALQALAEVFGQLLSALQSAHDAGLVHRDVKPDNAMVKQAQGYAYFVKVLDFGLAKSFDNVANGDADLPSLTESGAIVGTPQYMAPEQLQRAQIAGTDSRADLYAVGVMLFEILLKRRPYTEPDAMGLVFAKLDPERDPLLDIRELAQFGPLGQVVRTAMAWAPGDRFATANDFRSALTDAVEQLGPALTWTEAAANVAATSGNATMAMAAPAPPPRKRHHVITVPTPMPSGQAVVTGNLALPSGPMIGTMAYVDTLDDRHTSRSRQVRVAMAVAIAGLAAIVVAALWFGSVAQTPLTLAPVAAPVVSAVAPAAAPTTRPAPASAAAQLPVAAVALPVAASPTAVAAPPVGQPVLQPPPPAAVAAPPKPAKAAAPKTKAKRPDFGAIKM